MFTVTGGTYAYLAFTASDNSTIAGTTATASLDLVVERILPSSNVGVMVPQIEEYLDSAISDTYSCIDGNGNTVCQVYKATVTNTSTATVEVNGTIKFSGIENMPNLKWKRITNERTIGEYTSNIASTSNVIFEQNKVLTKNESDTYYFVIWIDEIETEQTDSGTFRVTIEFNPANGDGLTSTITNGEGGESQPTQLNAYATSYMVPVKQSDASIDFSQTSEASNTNGVYVRSGTENDTYPIYYYRGNVNNNLIFADTCWKVVRTTETGGLKLIYNGLPVENKCNNTGAAANIGTKVFNENNGSPTYVGYMYGTPHDWGYKSISSSGSYVFGNDITYSNGTYTLINTISANWDYIYDDGLINNHYTCFTTGTTCKDVYYIYNIELDGVYYLTLTGGKNIETALSEMLDNNTTSSTIKETIDSWYYTNIEQKGYSNYVEDTVWCNDRSIYSLGAFNPNGGETDAWFGEVLDVFLHFSLYDRIIQNSPILNCSRNIDKFTKDEANGNGDLDYPIGLLTADEVMLAGGNNSNVNETYYLYSGKDYWTGSPIKFIFSSSNVIYVSSSGIISGRDVDTYSIPTVRPSISLKSGFTLTGEGDGSADSPYKLNYGQN